MSIQQDAGAGEARTQGSGGAAQAAIRAIEAQQAKVKPRSPQWMVGEQLKDICRREPKSAELIVQDLKVEDMSITAAEKKIKAFADKHKTGNFSCVTPDEADGILRKFYGLPKPEDTLPEPSAGEARTQGSGDSAIGTASPDAESDRAQALDTPVARSAAAQGPEPVRPPAPPAYGIKPMDLMDFL